MSFKVSVTGYASADQEASRSAFAAAFKITQEQAAEMLARLPRVIKDNLDAAGAQRYRDALTKMRLTVEVLDKEAAMAASIPASVVPETPEKPVPSNAPQTEIGEAPRRAPAPSVMPAEAPRPGLKFRIDGQPDFAFLTVQIPANQTIKVEASAMATMDTHIRMKTKLGGGLGRFLTGESIFINEFSAEKMRGEIGIAPGAPGDLAHVYLKPGEVMYLQNGAFVASDMGITLESKWQGFTKGFFSGESFFLIRASGEGDLWFNTYGGLIEKDVDGEYVVDTGNIVAFTDGLDYKVEKFGGYKSLFFSGEGFVCRFRGKGRVWIQTRTSGALLGWAEQYRRSKKSD